MGMLEDTHPDHDFYQLFSEPANVGFAGTARYRTWVIGAHKERATCLYDPFHLQSLLTSAFQQNVNAQVGDFLVASEAEILLEASCLARRRNIPVQVGQKDLRYLLLRRENNCRQELDSKYIQRYGDLPATNSNLVYFLGDSAEYCSWSASSNKIPTYRLNSKSGLYWIPRLNRWLTSKERLCSMSFPCIREIADAMNVPLLGATDAQRAADLCGNSMHFTTCGIMQLISLVCFGPGLRAEDDEEGVRWLPR